MGRVLSLVAICLLVVLSTGIETSSADPNDPAWPYQWGPRLTRAADLWQLTTGSPSTVIAVVDTGLTPIPELQHLVPGWDVVGNDAETGDVFGHGTWVASVIGAAGNDAAGITGYCWNCSIMPVRVASGREGAIGPMIAAGIRWAVDHGARIVNVSLASNGFDWDEAGAAQYAQEHGVLLVAAAGNGGDTSYRYPAAYPGVLSVAGSDEHDVLEDWSTRGPWVTVSAPGCEMVVDPTVGPSYGCGSSFAPPAVAGIAGLLWSLDPGLTVNEITDALRRTAHPVAGIGSGRVDAWAAAHDLGLAPPEPAPASPPPAPPVPTPAASRQVLLTTGLVRRRAQVLLDVSAGRLALQLVGAAAADCSLSLRVGGEVLVGLFSERNVRSLAATVPAGRHAVTLSCRTARPKSFELSATGMFPSG